jgi:DNA-binding SARP family transcriptional activator
MADISRHQDRPNKAAGESRSTPVWRLSLLGAWQLACADQAVEVGANGQRLFALLAVRGACDRSYLSGVLWPDCSDPHAHGNLRATLSRLHRRNLTAAIRSANGVLSLRDAVEVDVRRLVATASAVLDGTLWVPDRSTLGTLAGQDLLLGWYEDWVLLERERLRQLRLHALEAMSDRLLAAGDAKAALEAALAAVAVEPLRESAHRAVIRAHLAEGNRAEALRQLHRLRDLLRRELAVDPSDLAGDLFR